MKHQRSPRRFSVVAATLVLASFGATACSSTPDRVATPSQSAPVTDGGDTGPRVVSAAEGAAARSRYAQTNPAATAGAETKVASDSTFAVGCGVYEPTQEEIDASNADAEGLAAEFDRYGLTYERAVDDLGFVMITYDYSDVVAESVAGSYWNARYPVEPISQEQLDENRAQNDVIAGEFEAAGVEFTRTTGEDGWETLEYDYEDPAAQAAVDAAWLIISPPQPPTAEELDAITADNAKITAAFDAAGIDYELVTDELGWAWVEWDYEDPAITDQVAAVFAEIYDVPEVAPAVECPVDVAVEEPAVIADPAVTETETADSDDVATEIAPPEVSVGAEPILVDALPFEPGSELTPDQIAQRDAEVAALEAGFASAGVTAEVMGESPWQTVIFDIANDASVPVVAGVLASRT